jgi:hypothetical protein
MNNGECNMNDKYNLKESNNNNIAKWNIYLGSLPRQKGKSYLPGTDRGFCDTRMMSEENGSKPDNEYCFYHQTCYLNVHIKKALFKCECGLLLCDECEESVEHHGHIKTKIK